ncbi:MAG: NFACT RNA binding domain-containing protein, partial [Eubacteriales bacterium]|nr:NFACT RNA binding domain-containing protein [Eubacteriales bacterium]
RELEGAKLERIIMSDRHTIVLSFYNRGQKTQLLLGSNPSLPELQYGVNLKLKSLNPPPAFVLTLRKYLLGSRLIAVNSPPYERILDFSFEAMDDLGDLTEKRLIVEFMSRVGNIILVNRNGVIHTALRHVDHSVNRYRETLPAHPYVAPPPQNKLLPDEVDELSVADIFQQQKANDDLSKAVYKNIAGFSPALGRETAYRAGLNSERVFAGLSEAEQEKLRLALIDMCQEISGDHIFPALYYDDSVSNSERHLVDVHSIRLKHLPYFDSFATAMDAVSEYYVQIKTVKDFQTKKQALNSVLEEKIRKAERKRELHEEDRARGKEAELYKLYGELLLSNLHRIKDSRSNVIVSNYYDENKEIEIELDPQYSPADNANRYFDKYARNKRRLGQAEKLLSQDAAQLAYLESIKVNLNCASDFDDLLAIEDELSDEKPTRSQKEQDDSLRQEPGRPASKRRRSAQYKQTQKSKKQTDKGTQHALAPRRFFSSDNLNIVVGRNNKQNDRLTLRQARKDDLWFHIKDAPGAHVLIMAEGQEIPEQTILEAAGLAAWFAGTNRAGGAKTSVDYTETRHVWRPRGAKPGHVLYDNFRTVLVYPLDPANLKKVE